MFVRCVLSSGCVSLRCYSNGEGGHWWRLGPPLGVLTPISKAHQESINTSRRGQRLHTLRHMHDHMLHCLRRYPSDQHTALDAKLCTCASLSSVPVCLSLSWCEVGEQIGGQQGGQARVTPCLSCVCVCISLCFGVWTGAFRARWQAEVNKIDGVDSNYKFIVAIKSLEDKYIRRNYDGRDRNEYLTFHIRLSLLLFF